MRPVIAVIALAALAPLAACPPVPLACDDETPCPGSQLCGADGFCSAAEGEGDAAGEGEGDAGEGEGDVGGEGEGEGGEGEGDAGEGEGDAGEGEGDAGGEGEGEGDAGGEGEGDAGEGEGEGEGDTGVVITFAGAGSVAFGADVTVEVDTAPQTSCDVVVTKQKGGEDVAFSSGFAAGGQTVGIGVLTESLTITATCGGTVNSADVDVIPRISNVSGTLLLALPSVLFDAEGADTCSMLVGNDAPVLATVGVGQLAHVSGSGFALVRVSCTGTGGDVVTSDPLRFFFGDTDSVEAPADAVAFVTGTLHLLPSTQTSQIRVPSLLEAGNIDVPFDAGAPGPWFVTLASLRAVKGNITDSGNIFNASFDAVALTTIGGTFEAVTDGSSFSSIGLGALVNVGGDFIIAGNDALTFVDIASLQTVDGNVDVEGSYVVDLSALKSVAGNLKIETDNLCDALSAAVCGLSPLPASVTLKASGVECIPPC